jgi:hypothetical protein
MIGLGLAFVFEIPADWFALGIGVDDEERRPRVFGSVELWEHLSQLKKV